MPLSDQTTERLKSLQRRAQDIMDALHVPSDEAWHMMMADQTQRVAAVADKIDDFQRRKAEADYQAMSARAATYGSKLGLKKKD